MQLEQGVKVGIIDPQPDHPRAGPAVERLQHHVAVPGAEVPDRLDVGGDQGRRLQAGKAGDQQLLGRVAHLHGVVHHQGLRVDPLQEIGGGDVGHVERRVLAHQHHVELRDVADLRLAQRVVVALERAQVQRPAAGQHPAVFQRQLLRREVPEAVTAGLALHHHQEGGVGLDVDPFDGIHLNGDLEGHANSRSEGGPAAA